MAKKLLTKKEIDSLGASLLEVDLQSLSKSTMEALSQSPQTSMKQFPSRSTFMKKMQSDEMQEKLQHFVFGLCQLYKSCLIKYKAKTKIDKFAAFQVGWLQSIRGIVEKGEELATSCEETDDPEDMTEEERKLAEEVSYFVLECFDAVPSTDDLLAIFHTIARHVFHHMQSRALIIKESQLGDAEAVTDATDLYEDSDDVLLRICGAQLNKMIVLRKETLKSKQSKNIDVIHKELNFLQSLTMNTEQKEESLSTALKSTERGGRTFPVVHMLPFIREIVRRVRGDINETTFRQYGEKLFQVTQVKLQCDQTLRNHLYKEPTIQAKISEHIAVADKCIDQLVEKLVNACKKNWEVTHKRHEQASGSKSSISLNLRDMLKAHIAK